MSPSPDPRPGPREIRAAALVGLRDSLSIAIGYVPVAISFGLAAIHAGLSPAMAVLVSLVVYAGASQFILVSLIAAGAGPATVTGLVILMNLRHFFYGAAVLDRLDPLHRRLPMPALAAGLTDEVFATSIGKMRQQPAATREYWYAALQLGAYASWVLGTAAGAWFGQGWLEQSPWLSETLGFVLPALFFALLLEIRHLVATRVLAASAAVAILSMAVLPGYAAIIAGMAAGALTAARFAAPPPKQTVRGSKST